MEIKPFTQTVFSAVLGAGIALSGFYFLKEEDKKRVLSTPIQIPITQTSASIPIQVQSFEDAAAKSVNSVVHIKTVSTQTSPVAYDPFQEFFFGRPGTPQQEREVAGSGSGVIISNDGYIATNHHVIKGAKKIEVTLNDKRTYEAQLIGKDPTTDLALLKIEAEDLSAILYGNSDDLKIGAWVLAVGNPFNLTSTVTAGIVSAKGRNINILKDEYAIESFIQTDAAVNPGNSGGALVNQEGKLVGINTAIASNTGSYTGYSFAVPVNMVKKIMADLKQFGTVQRGLLGVQIQNLSQEIALENSTYNLEGVFVSGVIENSAADEGGLQKGDIIRKVQNTPINSVSKLQEQIGLYRPGDQISLIIERNGSQKAISIQLKNKLGTTEKITKEVLFLGAQFQKAPQETLEKLGLKNGVQIIQLEQGKLLEEGIKKGFVITKINQKPVDSPEDIEKTLKNKKGGVLIEGIYPNGARAYYGFGL